MTLVTIYIVEEIDAYRLKKRTVFPHGSERRRHFLVSRGSRKCRHHVVLRGGGIFFCHVALVNGSAI